MGIRYIICALEAGETYQCQDEDCGRIFTAGDEVYGAKCDGNIFGFKCLYCRGRVEEVKDGKSKDEQQA